jgi:UDP-galactopyranose mutase
MKKILVVGAGFSGATVTGELVEAGYSVDIIDQRPHIVSNSYDEVNDLGLRIHEYGLYFLHNNNLGSPLPKEWAR